MATVEKQTLSVPFPVVAEIGFIVLTPDNGYGRVVSIAKEGSMTHLEWVPATDDEMLAGFKTDTYVRVAHEELGDDVA